MTFVLYEHQSGRCPTGRTCPGHFAPFTPRGLARIDRIRTAGALAYVGPAPSWWRMLLHLARIHRA